MNRKESIECLKKMDVQYVTYGDSDLGMPVKKEDAISDWEQMEDEMWGEGTWYVCDGEGKILK